MLQKCIFLCIKTSNNRQGNFLRANSRKKLKKINNLDYSDVFLPGQFDCVTSFIIIVVIGYIGYISGILIFSCLLSDGRGPYAHMRSTAIKPISRYVFWLWYIQMLLDMIYPYLKVMYYSYYSAFFFKSNYCCENSFFIRKNTTPSVDILVMEPTTKMGLMWAHLIS